MSDTEEPVIEKNSHMEQHAEKQKENLANTIQKRKGISLLVGLEELGKAMSRGSEKPGKNDHNQHHISEELEQYEKKIIKKRPPITLN